MENFSKMSQADRCELFGSLIDAVGIVSMKPLVVKELVAYSVCLVSIKTRTDLSDLQSKNRNYATM